jgi:streptogramin lyase
MYTRAVKHLALTGLLALAAPGLAWADRTYTTDADFDQGTLTSVNHDAPQNNQLQLSLNDPSLTDPYLWVANYGIGTVTKVDTRTGKQVGKYDTVLMQNWDGTVPPVNSPRSGCNSPSRTAVDGDGNSFVANRAFCGEKPSLTKYAGTLGYCVDRNGNGQIDTSKDANNNGTIEMSDPAEFFGQADECILWTKSYSVNGDLGRSVTVDGNNNLWVGGFYTSRLFKVNGATGALEKSIDPNAATGITAHVYGLAIGPEGYIYTSDPTYLRLRKVNPNAPAGQEVVSTLASPVPTYGIAVDKNGIVWLGNWSGSYRGGVVRADFVAGTVQVMPAPTNADCTGWTRGVSVDGDGNVWVACWSTSRLLKYNSAGVFQGSWQMAPGPLGVSIDSSLKVWTANQSSDSLTRFDPTNGTTQSFPAGGDPYSYWDMTGFQQRNFAQRQGNWTDIHDSGVANKDWATVRWNQEAQGSTPANTTITVFVRASDDESTLPNQQFVEVANGVPFNGVFGRYLEIKVFLRTTQVTVSPVLSDLKVESRNIGTWVLTQEGLNDKKLLHKAVRLQDGRVLVVGGHQTNTELYDSTTDTWSDAAPTSTTRRNHTATLLADGRVLVAGGAGGNLDATTTVYNPSTNTWSASGNMTQARRYHTATLMPDGQVLVVGGASTTLSTTAELYNPATGTWTATGSLTFGRREHTANLLPDGRVLVAGGFNSSGAAIKSAEVYDPTTGSWSPVGDMTQVRVYHSATSLPDGRVLVAGSHHSQIQPAATAEIFDPATNTWTATASMLQPRRYHAAVLLENGLVLVSGGHNQMTGNHAAADLYNPATGTWSSAAPMERNRYSHSLTLLPNGKALAVGGYSAIVGTTPSGEGTAEVFTP